jgi:hypothetical protein
MRLGRKMLAVRASIVLIAIAMVLVLTSNAAMAGSGPITVRGYIKDSAGTPLQGASVFVEIIAPDTTVRTSGTYLTNSAGLYSAAIGTFDWEVGDKINVTSTYLGNVGNNWTTATSLPVQYVNVTYTYEIPEFGSMTGLLVAAGAIGLVACVALLWTRRK